MLFKQFNLCFVLYFLEPTFFKNIQVCRWWESNEIYICKGDSGVPRRNFQPSDAPLPDPDCASHRLVWGRTSLHSGRFHKCKTYFNGKKTLYYLWTKYDRLDFLILIPLSDCPQAFISCGLGVHMIGYVMICYGACDAVCSVCCSPIVKVVGRLPVFILGCVANTAAIIILFVWEPNSNDVHMFFIVAALWGLADAVWQTQINGQHRLLKWLFIDLLWVTIIY